MTKKISTNKIDNYSNDDDKIVNSFLLCSFFGVFGAHSFYNKKYLIGFLQLISFGGLVLWAMIDWCILLKEDYRNNRGERLRWARGKKGLAAGLKIRLCAAIIDLTILIILILPIILLDLIMIIEINLNYLILTFIISAAYFTLFTSSKKLFTPGKMICHIKVISSKKTKLTFTQSLIRFISYLISATPFLLGFLAGAFNSKKQCWHDKLAKTLVIYER